MRRSSDAGSAVVTGVIGIVLLLVVFIGALSVVVDEYAKGALRTAVDEGAQAGAAAGGSVTSCETKARQVGDNLLRGPLAGAAAVSCHIEGDEMVASFAGTVHGFSPPVPPVRISVTGFSVIEEVPAQ
jgi:hypothetical protein